MSSPSKRRDMDVMKLMMSDFEVSLGEGASPNDFYVKFHGPKQSPYEGGIWKIHVTLPVNYPYSSPSIGFTNHIYHPNVDFASGSVCLDVINQTWSPMYNLVNVFSTFLPQLLLYPNPADPLNGEAASVMNRNKDEYNKKVIELVKKYASADIKVKMDDDEEAATTTTGAARASTVPTAKKPTVSSSSSSSSSSTTTPPSSASDTKEKEEPEEEEEELSDLDDEPAGTMEDM